MRRFVLSLSLLCLITTACGGSSGEGQNSDNERAATSMPSSIVIEYPRDSTVIYAETLHIAGQLQGNTPSFVLELLDTEDQVIRTITVNAEPGEWSVELPHGYSGDPTEISIRAMPVSAAEGAQPLDVASVLLTAISNRPEGIFGSLLVPGNGAETGGDMLLVSGRVSGVDEITVTFSDDINIVRDTQTVMLVNPYLIDDVPWQAEITIGDYTGQAEIRAFALAEDGSEIELGSARITVTQAAG